MTPCLTGSLFICLCIINSWTCQKNWEIPRSYARNSRKTLRKQSTKFCFSLLFSRIHKTLSEKRKLIKCFLSNSFYKRLGPWKKRARVGHASCEVIYIVATEQSSFDETPGEGTFPGWISLISNFSLWKPRYELFWFRFWSVLYERYYISKYYWNDVEKTATLVKLMIKVRRHNSISRKNYSLSNISHALIFESFNNRAFSHRQYANFRLHHVGQHLPILTNRDKFNSGNFSLQNWY